MTCIISPGQGEELIYIVEVDPKRNVFDWLEVGPVEEVGEEDDTGD